MPNLLRKIYLGGVALFCLSSGLLQAAPVDFVKDIEPIFSTSCISCHGPDKAKGGLRLDSKAATFKGGEDGVVLVAGQADKSDLYRRVALAPGSDDIMPSKGDPLTKAQQALIKDWINQGAVWPDGAIAKAAAEEPAAVSIFAGLTAIKPSAAELAAVTKLSALGVEARPIATNVTWRGANFHSRGTNATDSSLVPLKDIPTVVDLNLAGTKITDAGLQNIEGLTNLLFLHLEHTQITDAGLAHLKKLNHLVYLNLYATSVTDAGLQSLKGLTGLQHLYLWQTKVTTASADDLKKALPKLQISRGWENEPGAQKVAAKPEPKPEAKAEAKAEVKK